MYRLTYSLLLVMLFAVASFAQIANSDHDFSGTSWGSSEICLPCHTPHNSDLTVSDAPLWNHEVTQADFTLYSSPTLNATINLPSSNSKLCLSCHDGTVALDNYGGNTGGTNFITGSALIGTDLSNDHPVSFVYNDALATADGGLYPPSSTSSGLGGMIEDDLLFGDPDFSTLECASCHDAHNGYGNPSLLIISNAGSEFCLLCHDK